MLRVTDLYTAYGQSEVLHGLSFEARANETVAIMGRNGMGKTTLFKSLIGMIPSKSGRIEVAGQDVARDESHRRVAKGIAFVPQGRMIFPTLTVEENILTGLENAKVKRIPDDVYALFPVLFDMRKRRGGNLSGGQQQQLAIARALVTDPKVLLLDEPTAGMGPEERWRMIETVQRLWRARGMTLIFIEHDMDIVFKVAQTVRVLSYGAVLAEGTPEEVRRNPQVIEAYLGKSAHGPAEGAAA